MFYGLRSYHLSVCKTRNIEPEPSNALTLKTRKPHHSQERFNVNLQRADGVFQLVLLQHGRMEDTKGANDVLLSSYAYVNGRSVAWEVSWVYLVENVSRDNTVFLALKSAYHQAPRSNIESQPWPGLKGSPLL